VAAQIAELRRQRDQLSLRMPAALWITGGALAVATVGLAIPGGIALFNDCDYDDDCGNERGRNLLIAAGSVAAAAAAFGISGMVLFGQRKRRLLRIRQELLQLTAPVVSVGGSFDRRGVNLSLRATF